MGEGNTNSPVSSGNYLGTASSWCSFHSQIHRVSSLMCIVLRDSVEPICRSLEFSLSVDSSLLLDPMTCKS